jgi:hypothetical protein
MAQESLQDLAREPGFYWVKLKYESASAPGLDDWEIARWAPGWELCSIPDGYGSCLLDEIIEIDERRIERVNQWTHAGIAAAVACFRKAMVRRSGSER